MLTIIAFIPFVLLVLLIIFLKWPAIKVMPLVWFITLLIVLLFWKLSSILILASFVKGVLLSLEIILIIFGAVWIIEIMQEKDKIKTIQSLLVSISPDIRIQGIFIAWLFGSLIEGIAGFGTPAALAAPLLVSLGFNPILSVVISLIANSTAQSFGAVGTPVLFGLGKLGFDKLLLKQVYIATAFLHLIASIIIPISILYFIVSFYAKENKKKRIFEMIPFALLSWLSFLVPYFLTAFFIGPELPSIIGALTALLITGFAAHYKILVPKNLLSFNKKIKKDKISLKSVLFSAAPYLIIILLLSISRIIPYFQKTLSGISIEWGNIFNTSLNYEFLPVYTPSFYLIISAIICLFLFNVEAKNVKVTLSRTFDKIKKPTITLIFALAFIQLIIISADNQLNLPGIHLVLAQFMGGLFKQFYIFIAPLIGVFGAFISGSNTLSNFLFGLVQYKIAISLGLSTIFILALQVVGGAVGNAIALHDILAASATVGIENKEGFIIRKTITVVILYSIIASLAAIILINF
ncbi:MAG: L-lactate permease [Nanoarchaeota archaeon]